MNISKSEQPSAMYCPKCGSHDFVSKTIKSFQCAKCGFLFFMNSAAAVVGLIFNRNGELLLTRRKHDPCANMLDLPGGFIDYNESAEQGLAREIKEEMNIEAGSMEYFATLPNIYHYAGVTYNTLDIAFICNPPDIRNIKPDDDITGYVFMRPELIDLKEVGLASAKEFIRMIQLRYKQE